MEPNLSKSNGPQIELTTRQKMKLEQEMKHQVISFTLMIFLTALAFISVASDVIPASFAIPFILLLAVIQVVLQLYYFMHLNQKGHEWPNAFIMTGIFIAVPTVAALMLLLGVMKF